jgi:capsular polysaccharide biosynthesis protein
MFNIVEPVHNINLKTMGSFSNFNLGLSPEGEKSLNFLQDDTVYVFVDAIANFHHFILTILTPALQVIELIDNEKLHFVLHSRSKKQIADNFDNLLIELLLEKNINYTSVNSSAYDYVNAKNFIPINGVSIEKGIPILYDYLIKKYNLPPAMTNKKIYVSRSKYGGEEKRIDDEKALEKLFEENGFQIVYPEEIKTFREQFELFNSCSVLAGLTGSGLTNLILMPKNQIVLEIVTKLKIGVTDSSTGQVFTEEQIHDHYKEFSIIKDHIMITIFNMDKSVEDVQKKIELTMKSLKLLSI